MKKHLLLTGIMFVSFIISAQNVSLTQTVKGTIIDEQSGDLLQSASIILEGNSSKAGISHSSGNFKLKKVPIVRHAVRVSLIGYEEAVIRNIEVTSSKGVVLEIRLKERIKKLEEVVVRAVKQKNRALLEEQLQPNKFYRINRQLLVNIDAVSKVHTWLGGRLKLELMPAAKSDKVVSRERVNGFKVWLGQ